MIRRRIMPGSESQEHQVLIQWIRLIYPQALFRTDMGGVRLTMGQAIAAKKLQHSRAFPDIAIYEPRNGYHGLFIEYKKSGTKLYLKDGVTMVANDHYKEQTEVLRELTDRGYKAVFCVGIEEAQKVISEYMK